MDVTGRYTFDAPLVKVWDMLMDPVVVCSCLPGCQGLRPLGDDKYEAVLTIAVAAITGTFKGTIAIEDKWPLRSYAMVVEGSGGPGFVHGRSTITLSQEGEKTVLDVAGSVQVGGMIARVGQRLLAGVSKMMMDRFFGRLQERATAG